MTSRAPNGAISLFVRHPVAGNLLMLLMLIFGVYGLSKLNRQVMPDFELDIVSVSVQWPGASPEDVESNIIAAIEPEVRFLDNAQRIDATAYDGHAEVQIMFDENVDISKALTDVQAAIARITTFPTDIEQPIIQEVIPPDLICQIEISGPFPEQALKTIAKRMRDDLLDRGISRVILLGARDKEIWVEVKSEDLRRLDLTVDDVATRIGLESLDLPSGSIESGGIARQIRSKRLARSTPDVGRIEIVSKASGEKLHVREFARVREAFEKNAVSHLQNGEIAIGLSLARTKGSDSIVSQRIVTEYLKEIRAELPPTVRVDLFDVMADQTTQRVRMLVTNGIGGLVLVLIVLYVFLNGRIAFWVAMGIPVAIFATLGGMAIMGMSLNLMSMFAIIMGLGIIVDDAIVVGEHTEMLHRRGMSPDEATMTAARVMFAPVLAASLTTVAAFLPMLTIGREIGQIVRELPLTMMLVIAASLAECFLVLPMHLKGALQRLNRSPQHRPSRFQRAFIDFRETHFNRAVKACFKHRYSTALATVCAFLLTLTLLFSGQVGFEFFPAPESDMVFANFSLTPGTPRNKAEAMIDELARAALLTEERLTDGKRGVINYQLGELGTNEGRQSEAVLNGDHFGAFVVELVSGDDRSVRTNEFVAAWQAEIRPIAGLESLVIYERSAAGPPGRDLDIRLHGASLDRLKEAALVTRRGLENIPGVLAVEDNLPYGLPQIIMKMTPAGLAMDFTPLSVARQVRDSVEGAIAKRFSQDQEEIIIRVKSADSDNQIPATIRDLYLRAPDGSEVPLTEVVTLKTKVGYSQIRREDGLRQVSVTGDVDSTITTTNAVLETAERTITPDIEQQFGVNIEFKGKAEEQQSAVADTLVALLIAIAMMYVILSWVFSSYTTPIIVMSIIPFGLIGAIVGHWILGYNVNMFSLQALLGLSGVMINDSIILVSSVKRYIKNGETLPDAVSIGARERLRPVMLTTLTTIGGLTPLLFERSLQAQLVQPLAVTLIFGLLFSPFLVLFFVPSLLGIGNDLRAKQPVQAMDSSA